MPSEYQRKERAFLKVIRRNIGAREGREMRLLAEKWKVVSDSLSVAINKLAEAGLTTPYRVHQSAIYRNMLIEAKQQISQYARTASGIIAKEQAVYIDYGWAVASKGVTWTARRLPTQAILNMIGKTSEGSPLYDIIMRDYPEAMARVTDILVSSTARGINPRQTARLMAKEADGPYWKSLRIARTEQMNAFRQSTTEGMKTYGIDQWERIEEDDCCDECAELNGQIYDLDDEGEWHPNCRGSKMPVLP